MRSTSGQAQQEDADPDASRQTGDAPLASSGVRRPRRKQPSRQARTTHAQKAVGYQRDEADEDGHVHPVTRVEVADV